MADFLVVFDFLFLDRPSCIPVLAFLSSHYFHVSFLCIKQAENPQKTTEVEELTSAEYKQLNTSKSEMNLMKFNNEKPTLKPEKRTMKINLQI